MKDLLSVKTRRLVLVAGIVWMIAGFNIALIGLGEYTLNWGWAVLGLIAASIVIFTMFHLNVFNKMVKKHVARIESHEEEKLPVWYFFDAKSYLIMAFMMGGGIGLRMSGLLPDCIIAFFYTGLGAALFLAGVSFCIRYFAHRAVSCPFNFRKASH